MLDIGGLNVQKRTSLLYAPFTLVCSAESPALKTIENKYIKILCKYELVLGRGYSQERLSPKDCIAGSGKLCNWHILITAVFFQ